MHHGPRSPNPALFVSVTLATAFSSLDVMGRRKMSPVGVLDRCKCGHTRGGISEMEGGNTALGSNEGSRGGP